MPARQLLTRTTALALGAGIALAALPAAAQASAPDSASAPTITVYRTSAAEAPGYTFIAPKAFSNPVTTPSGPEILDGAGRPVWWHQVTPGVSATDFRVQTYRGRPVLTWNEGVSSGGPGHSEGTDYIADAHYRIIAKVRAGNGLSADQHEFQLTSRGTALITSYHVVHRDLRSVGGPADGQVLDCDVQEIDVRTGKVIFQWDALKHVPLSYSYQPLPADATSTPWDYFHLNAVHVDTDGNLLVDSRHTWTVFKVQRHTGHIIWRLGGKHSSFTLGRGVRFAWQHDPEAVRPGVYRIFDNESNGTSVRPNTRIITIRANTRTYHATLLRSLTYPGGLVAASQGNAQLLPDGHLMVGWGQTGRFSEFDAAGHLLFDAQVPAGDDDYRAYRMPWVGRPLTRPTALASAGGDRTTVQAIWNGATEVRSWQVLAGPDAGHLRVAADGPWNGLSTSLSVPGTPTVVRVVARDAHDRVLGRSIATHVSSSGVR